MKIKIVALLAVTWSLYGCTAIDHLFCMPDCRSETQNTSSLVNFLYPSGKAPPSEDTVPQLHVPLRVGVAFLPSRTATSRSGLDAALKERLLQRISQKFADRKFVADIVIIPDYYLMDKQGFAGLEGVQRLYNVDVMALVSYDQVAHMQDNDWSLSYITIVGAYIVKGTRHDLSTLVDLAVVDPASHSLILRAGGTDVRHDSSTLLDSQREVREDSAVSFSVATDQLITNFDAALKKFEDEVHAGRANVKVVRRNSDASPSGGSGAITFWWLIPLLGLAAIRRSPCKLG